MLIIYLGCCCNKIISFEQINADFSAPREIEGYRLVSDHSTYPGRVIYGSENRYEAAWKATRDREHIFGQFLWTGIDYLGSVCFRQLELGMRVPIPVSCEKWALLIISRRGVSPMRL